MTQPGPASGCGPPARGDDAWLLARQPPALEKPPARVIALVARSDQRHEAHFGQSFRNEVSLAGVPDAHELLFVSIGANWNEASADLELRLKGCGYRFSTRGHENGVEGCRIWPALGSIRVLDVHVAIAGIMQGARRLLRQLPDALDGEDFAGDLGEHGSGVARPCADLEQAGVIFIEPDGRGGALRSVAQCAGAAMIARP
jgi:hypothetical protein